MSHVGEIRYVPAGQISRYGHGAWYVVDEDRGEKVFGYRFTLPHDSTHSGAGLLDVSGCDYVPDDEVPDAVWAALAKWRLTGEQELL